MKTLPPFEPIPVLAAELELPPAGVSAVLELLAAGNTVPFIARYRKEATGSLDEVKIGALAERHAYLLELHQRRGAILDSIAEQGKLTAELRAQILAAETKAKLEDLYLPYRPKRRTRATLARERGLGPLAERILAQPDSGDPLAEAATWIDPERGVSDAEAALAGARDIAAEQVAERVEVRALVREAMHSAGLLVVEVLAEKRDQPTKFQQYHDHREPVATIPSHRFLAIRRGEREAVLRARIEIDAQALLGRILDLAGHRTGSPFGQQLRLAVEDGYTRLLAPSLENEVRSGLKERADRAAVEVFAQNLRNLLMAAPLGDKPVLGVDPGLRTGSKVAALAATGKFLDHTTWYLVGSSARLAEAREQARAWIRTQRPAALAVGNGTGSRETEEFLRAALEDLAPEQRPVVVQVNEAGASVYSASEQARGEFPELDLTVRGAISIGRRLQDPLAELVKIEPKAIGVGQYQHDVHQPLLAAKLDEVVVSCVNRVGVDLNTASAALLARVAGIGPKLAGRIVARRDTQGAYRSRRQLLEVSGLGAKTFEQAAGFLRVRLGEHPLDASAVHPERYDLVERMAADLGVALERLVGDAETTARIEPKRYLCDEVGEPTLRDILEELKKPGRDPRAAFDPVHFREDVRVIGDLRPGMRLQGVVTNVTAFGAFVDIGVHRDGLVHVSQLADRFVADPHQAVKVGDRLSVVVLEVDLERDRISLSARTQPEPPGQEPGRPPDARSARPGPSEQADQALTHNPFADLFKKP